MIGKLFVINLKSIFSGMFRTGGRKASAGKKVLFALLFIYVIAVFIFMFGALFQQICAAFYEAGFGWLYFAIIAILSFSLCVMTSIFTVQSLIFNAKDNELLLAMPVKPSAIIVSRILTLLVYEYIFDFMVAIPAFFVWWRSGFSTVGGSVILLLELLLMPLLALSIASIIGWLVAALTKSMRAKNAFSLIFSLAFLVLYFVFYMNLQKYMAELLANGEAIAQAIRKAAFPAYHFGIAAQDASLVSFLIFAACAAAPFALMCWILSKSFIRIATTKHSAPKVEYKQQALKQSSARGALVRIELRRFLSNSMIIMNAGIGALFIIALGVLLFVRPGMVTNLTSQLTAVLPGVSEMALCGALIMFCSSMIYYSSAAVSLEGKTLWLVKSLPMSGGEVLVSKALAHILISGAPALFASLACVIRLEGSPLDMLATILAPLSIAVATGFFGVIINLAFPKFDWTNVMQPVKQGISVMICMFSVMAFVIVLVLAYMFALSKYIDMALYMLACTVLLVLLSALMYSYLKNRGSRKFEALE